MQIEDAIRAVNEKFRYVPDPTDTWTFITERWAGDCEDYAATVAWLVCGESRAKFVWAVLTGAVQFHWARVEDSGHVVLRDPKSGHFVDNNMKVLRPKATFDRSGINIRARLNRFWVLWQLKRSLIAGGQP